MMATVPISLGTFSFSLFINRKIFQHMTSPSSVKHCCGYRTIMHKNSVRVCVCVCVCLRVCVFVSACVVNGFAR